MISTFFRERRVKSTLKEIDSVVNARRKTIQAELAQCRQQARALEEEQRQLMAVAAKSPHRRDRSAEAHWQRKQTQNQRVRQSLETQLMQVDKVCQQRDRAMHAQANIALVRSQAKLKTVLGNMVGLAEDARDDNLEMVDDVDEVERAMSELMEPTELEQELEGKEIEQQLDEVGCLSIFDEVAQSNTIAPVVPEIDRLLREREQMEEEIQRLQARLTQKPKKAKKKAIAQTQPLASATKIE